MGLETGSDGWNIRTAVAALLSAILLAGCRYSFTGASVPSHIKTIAIPLVRDQSGFGDPQRPEKVTNELVREFQRDNTLEVTNRGTADSMLEGTILSVRDEPVVVQGGERVSKRRITITVNARYEDMKLRKTAWQKDFSNWGDYDSGAGLTQRNAGVTEAIRKIGEDILIQTVSNW